MTSLPPRWLQALWWSLVLYLTARSYPNITSPCFLTEGRTAWDVKHRNTTVCRPRIERAPPLHVRGKIKLCLKCDDSEKEMLHGVIRVLKEKCVSSRRNKYISVSSCIDPLLPKIYLTAWKMWVKHRLNISTLDELFKTFSSLRKKGGYHKRWNSNRAEWDSRVSEVSKHDVLSSLRDKKTINTTEFHVSDSFLCFWTINTNNNKDLLPSFIVKNKYNCL